MRKKAMWLLAAFALLAASLSPAGAAPSDSPPGPGLSVAENRAKSGPDTAPAFDNEELSPEVRNLAKKAEEFASKLTKLTSREDGQFGVAFNPDGSVSAWATSQKFLDKITEEAANADGLEIEVQLREEGIGTPYLGIHDGTSTEPSQPEGIDSNRTDLSGDHYGGATMAHANYNPQVGPTGVMRIGCTTGLTLTKNGKYAITAADHCVTQYAYEHMLLNTGETFWSYGQHYPWGSSQVDKSAGGAFTAFLGSTPYNVAGTQGGAGLAVVGRYPWADVVVIGNSVEQYYGRIWIGDDSCSYTNPNPPRNNTGCLSPNDYDRTYKTVSFAQDLVYSTGEETYVAGRHGLAGPFSYWRPHWVCSFNVDTSTVPFTEINNDPDLWGQSACTVFDEIKTPSQSVWSESSKGASGAPVVTHINYYGNALIIANGTLWGSNCAGTVASGPFCSVGDWSLLTMRQSTIEANTGWQVAIGGGGDTQ